MHQKTQKITGRNHEETRVTISVMMKKGTCNATLKRERTINVYLFPGATQRVDLHSFLSQSNPFWWTSGQHESAGPANESTLSYTFFPVPIAATLSTKDTSTPVP